MQISNIGPVNNLFYYVGAMRKHRCVCESRGKSCTETEVISVKAQGIQQ